MIKNMKKNKEKNKKGDRKHSIYTISIYWTVLFIIILVTIFAGKYIFISLKYKQYTIKMKEYELNTLYDNKKANANQSVSKSEMIKVIIGSIINTKSVDGMLVITESYKNESWIEYAKIYGIIDNNYIKDLTVNGKDKKAGYVDAGAIISKSLETLLNKKVLKTGDVKYSNLDDFGDLKEYVIIAGEDHLYNKIKGSLKNRNIKKGELNKMIITIVEKYGLLDPSSQYQDVSIVTDKNKMPKNYKDYPYIIDSIENSVYEMDFKVSDQQCVKTPKEIYDERKEVYEQTYEKVKRYFDIILNIDYKYIDKDEFFNSLSDLFYYNYDADIVDKYVEHVKKNKIILKGTGTPLLPIIYNDGSQIRIRVKIEFRIVNTDTNKNIVFPDIYSLTSKEYKDGKYLFYSDIALGQLWENNSLKIMMDSLLDSAITNIDTIVKVKE